MLVNYGITALRATQKQQTHFILNVVGLSIGLASAILVALFALYELSFDQQQPNADRVYRVEQEFTSLNSKVPISNHDGLSQSILGLPVEDVFSLTSTAKGVSTIVSINDETFAIEGIRQSSANILEWVNLKVIHGDLKKTLITPNRLALNESEANRLFGNVDIVGQNVQINNVTWTIGAVFQDLEKNTHFSFSGLHRMNKRTSGYNNNLTYSYLRLEPEVEVSDVLPTLRKTFLELAYAGHPFSDSIKMKLQPLTGIHLNSNSPYEMKTNGSRTTVIICLGLSVLLISIATFNFINMSIAQSVKRAKEVGVRKALGAKKWHIIGQFFTEYLIITLISLLIACALVEILIPYFNAWVDRPLKLHYFSIMGLLIVVSSLFVSVFAGAYPAWVMSSFSAKQVLNGLVSQGKAAVSIRKTLLILQSSLSISLVIGAIILQLQLNHLNQLPMGYSKENRLEVSGMNSSQLFDNQNLATIDQLKAINGVNHVGIVDTPLTKSLNTSMSITTPNNELVEDIVKMVGVGFEAARNLGLTLIAGRDFNRAHSADWYTFNESKASSGIIITESLLKQAGYESAELAIGQRWTSETGNPDNNWEPISTELTIVGVVKDVNVGSVKSKTSGFFFICGYSVSNFASLSIQYDAHNLLAIKSEVFKVLKDLHPDYFPNLELIESQYAAIYRDDTKTSQVVSVFSGLAIFLACMGIFGLASFSALRRQKEIAIRKVLGASRLKLVNLLAQEYLLLIITSTIIAFPMAYWLLNKWLITFNERIIQPWWTYIFAAVIMSGITWLTVATVAFRASSVRPSLTLRRD